MDLLASSWAQVIDDILRRPVFCNNNWSVIKYRTRLYFSTKKLTTNLNLTDIYLQIIKLKNFWPSALQDHLRVEHTITALLPAFGNVSKEESVQVLMRVKLQIKLSINPKLLVASSLCFPGSSP